MADAVTSQTTFDGLRRAVMKFTNISDGTGESAVLKVDVSALSGAPARVSIDEIEFATAGMGVDIHWDATTDDLAWHVPANETGKHCFRNEGGMHNPKSSGWTGDIRFTTVDQASGDRYSIILHMIKKAD